jgi:hypothetical protein
MYSLIYNENIQNPSCNTFVNNSVGYTTCSSNFEAISDEIQKYFDWEKLLAGVSLKGMGYVCYHYLFF